MRTLLAIGLLLLSTASSATTPAEQEKIVADDRAAWANVKVVDEHYLKPPVGWQRAEDPDLHLAASFPCAPKKSGTEMVAYSCAVGHRVYSVVLMKGHFEQAVNMDYFLAAQAWQERKRFMDAYGPPVTSSPVMRVTYAGLQGRQEITSSSKVEVESRTVFLPGLAIQMAIGALPGKLQGDQSTFFNSLELGK